MKSPEINRYVDNLPTVGYAVGWLVDERTVLRRGGSGSEVRGAWRWPGGGLVVPGLGAVTNAAGCGDEKFRG